MQRGIMPLVNAHEELGFTYQAFHVQCYIASANFVYYQPNLPNINIPFYYYADVEQTLFGGGGIQNMFLRYLSKYHPPGGGTLF